jgi:pyrroloquinoline quinone biosynthesis protein E
VQDVLPEEADRVAGLAGSHAAKRKIAHATVRAGLALTINAVVHRGNADRITQLVDEAVALGAGRIEIAHTQFHGWAARNRAFLMPTRDQVVQARDAVASLRKSLAGRIVIDYVPPDYYARYPKPCMNGWGRRTLNVTPSGSVLPCHSAATIPGLVFANVRDQPLAEIWASSTAFAAFRGTDWMREPCLSCARKEIDFGGCRCQALALTGDARNADPVCTLSPFRPLIDEARAVETTSAFEQRRFAAPNMNRGMSEPT